jgi:hypothetical protein
LTPEQQDAEIAQRLEDRAHAYGQMTIEDIRADIAQRLEALADMRSLSSWAAKDEVQLANAYNYAAGLDKETIIAALNSEADSFAAGLALSGGANGSAYQAQRLPSRTPSVPPARRTNARIPEAVRVHDHIPDAIIVSPATPRVARSRSQSSVTSEALPYAVDLEARPRVVAEIRNLDRQIGLVSAAIVHSALVDQDINTQQRIFDGLRSDLQAAQAEWVQRNGPGDRVPNLPSRGPRLNSDVIRQLKDLKSEMVLLRAAKAAAKKAFDQAEKAELAAMVERRRIIRNTLNNPIDEALATELRQEESALTHEIDLAAAVRADHRRDDARFEAEKHFGKFKRAPFFAARAAARLEYRDNNGVTGVIAATVSGVVHAVLVDAVVAPIELAKMVKEASLLSYYAAKSRSL